MFEHVLHINLKTYENLIFYNLCTQIVDYIFAFVLLCLSSVVSSSQLKCALQAFQSAEKWKTA